MRHSFLPTNEQKALKKKYRIHATVVALFLLGVIGVIGIGSLLPAYIEVSYEERQQLAQARDATNKDGEAGTTQIMGELQKDAALVRELSAGLTSKLPSELIRDVISARASVKIGSIVITDMSTSTAVMVIQGIAPNRESLASFKARLEGFALGSKAESPISELAKSKDIPFSLRFTRILP